METETRKALIIVWKNVKFQWGNFIQYLKE